jgi:hypothetical protein
VTEIQFQIDDLDARRQLKRLGLFLSDLRTFWPLVIPLFIGWMRNQFESEGAFAGAPWAPLSHRYGIWKTVHYPGKPILQLKGELRQAASRPERRVTPRTLTLTIHDPKIAYHQTGTPRMPARPLVFDALPPVARRELEIAGERYIETLLQRL